MWCIYMCLCVSCSIVMLFTCTLVRSHPDSKEGVRCETRSIEIISKILDWTWQQDACSEREARRKLSLSLERGHEGRIRKVLQEDGCLSMYKSWLCVLTCIIFESSLSMPYNYQRPGNWFTLLTAVYFLQVKNKPWLPWVYTWIWHRREQFIFNWTLADLADVRR
jgi:hypothetical protein